jgi:hypothetical protein
MRLLALFVCLTTFLVAFKDIIIWEGWEAVDVYLKCHPCMYIYLLGGGGGGSNGLLNQGSS